MIRALVVAMLLSLCARVAAQEPVIEPTEDAGSVAVTETADEEPREPRRWETPVREPRRNALVFHPWSLIHRGVVAGYERALPDARFTLLGRASIALPAGGDFRSVQLGVSVEARFYPLARGPFTRWSSRAPVGVYVGARFGVLRTRLSDRRDDRLVGVGTRVVFETSLGYRFTIASRIEFSPYVGTLFYSDFLENFASRIRPTVIWGFTVGVLF